MQIVCYDKVFYNKEKCANNSFLSICAEYEPKKRVCMRCRTTETRIKFQTEFLCTA